MMILSNSKEKINSNHKYIYNKIKKCYNPFRGDIMNSNIINYLPENSKQLPINFYTVSNRYHEQAISRPFGQREFNQILLVIGGTGELKCQGKTYELKKGCISMQAWNTTFYNSHDSVVFRGS
jgi:hypothetical protein